MIHFSSEPLLVACALNSKFVCVFSNAVYLIHFNPLCASRNKSRLLFSSAEMFKKPLWQTVWTQNRLLL